MRHDTSLCVKSDQCFMEHLLKFLSGLFLVESVIGLSSFLCVCFSALCLGCAHEGSSDGDGQLVMIWLAYCANTVLLSVTRCLIFLFVINFFLPKFWLALTSGSYIVRCKITLECNVTV